jgi:hypothetical protein
MKASVIYELTGKVLGDCDDIPEAEALIEVFEQIDPDGVHAGDYGIDADEAAYNAYQKEHSK